MYLIMHNLCCPHHYCCVTSILLWTEYYPHPVRICVCVCVCRKHGRGPGRDYPVHQAGEWERCSDAAAGVQQRGNTTPQKLTHSSAWTIHRFLTSAHNHSVVISLLQFAQCFFFDAEERERRKVSWLLSHSFMCSLKLYLSFFLSHLIPLLHLIRVSPSPPRSLSVIIILLYQTSLILSPRMLSQIEPRRSDWITSIVR